MPGDRVSHEIKLHSQVVDQIFPYNIICPIPYCKQFSVEWKVSSSFFQPSLLVVKKTFKDEKTAAVVS